MAFDWTISGCPFLDRTLRIFDACSDFISTWDFDTSIVLIDLYWLRILMPWFLLCFIDIFVWDIDMLDYWWLILLLCLARWPWFYHDCSDHFTCIHSLLYIIRLDMLIHLLVYYFDHPWACCFCITIHLDCCILAYLVCTLMIYLRFVWLPVAWLPFFCLIACCLSMWVAHLSPYLSLFSLGHFLHYGSHFCKCETLCVLVLWPR